MKHIKTCTLFEVRIWLVMDAASFRFVLNRVARFFMTPTIERQGNIRVQRACTIGKICGPAIKTIVHMKIINISAVCFALSLDF